MAGQDTGGQVSQLLICENNMDVTSVVVIHRWEVSADYMTLMTHQRFTGLLQETQ